MPKLFIESAPKKCFHPIRTSTAICLSNSWLPNAQTMCSRWSAVPSIEFTIIIHKFSVRIVFKMRSTCLLKISRYTSRHAFKTLSWSLPKFHIQITSNNHSKFRYLIIIYWSNMRKNLCVLAHYVRSWSSTCHYIMLSNHHCIVSTFTSTIYCIVSKN